ncbi:MAG: CPBP family intramembrane glutamic endopeptidase [Synechococcaceae cyanobacterium]
MTPGGESGCGGPHWLSTLLYVPLLLAGGWVLARPLALLAPGWRPDQLDLAGLVLALLLLLASLPWRIRHCWGLEDPWLQLGLLRPRNQAISSGLQGLGIASLLLLAVTSSLLLSSQAHWLWRLDAGMALNAVVLGLGVGLAEELLFRGWLWGELAQGRARHRALLLQALIFALVHPWFRAGGLLAPLLLGGLLLLGLALANARLLDGGCLWGAIGLHGGLVGGWFVVQQGLVAIAPEAPGWWVGPGSGDVNPIGGLSGFTALAVLVIAQRTALARARRPSTGA